MRILITGNMGYVGPVLVARLRRVWPNAELIGYDLGLFGHCLTDLRWLPERLLDRQILGDVRTIDPSLLEGVDVVVNLAAVSNDPMGNRFAGVTGAINHRAAVQIANIAKDRGVRSYIFASSCSVYGFAEGGPRRESDKLDPLTHYARSKIDTEESLRGGNYGNMQITCLRFATACGFSPRLRLDLVLNDFVACALSSGTITILSDGTPWRPLIDVADMARAIEWAMGRNSDGGQFLAVNTGSDSWNVQVRELAEAVARHLPGTKVAVNEAAAPDRRSYRVNFELYRTLAPAYQPVMTLDSSIRSLMDGLKSLPFTDANFRNGPYMRLKTLERMMAMNGLSEDLRWLAGAENP